MLAAALTIECLLTRHSPRTDRLKYGQCAVLITKALKNFKYESFSDAEFELATIALIVFCLTEGFSIFHENLPKCGFNLWHQIKKMIGFVKEAKKEITE